jgi:ribosome-binding factor A
MPREYGRNRRVADLVQRELAGLLQREGAAIAAGLVTIAAAEVSPDLRHAKVFVTWLGREEERAAMLARLNDLAGHYRHHLAKTLCLRTVPHLTFIYDESLERGNRLASLIESVRPHDPADSSG